MIPFIYRGKDINNKWHIGNLTILTVDNCTIKAGHYISNSVGMPFAYQINPSTLGVSWGMKDKNGKLIFTDQPVSYTFHGYEDNGMFVLCGNRFIMIDKAGNEVLWDTDSVEIIEEEK